MNADQKKEESLEGFLPIDAVVVDGRPGLQWMDMSGITFADPFFQQTVDRVKAEGNRRELFTEFDVLLQLEKQLDSVPPTGLIFHSSRCGSTLMANACRAINNSIILSEAAAIDKLVARFITDPGDIKTSLYSVFLRAVVHTLAQRRTGNEQHLFIKFACCSFAQIERIRRIWPAVPWVFLYRDPVETIVSNLKDVPPWLLDNDRRVLASITGTTPDQVEAMLLEELCARTIGSLFNTAHGLANDNGMLLNYKQLSVSVISSVLRFFEVNLSTQELETIEQGSRRYSKEASGSRVFVADADAKQQLATDAVRDAAAKWATEPYQLLEQKRLERTNQFGEYS